VLNRDKSGEEAEVGCEEVLKENMLAKVSRSGINTVSGHPTLFYLP
jgi:hypothetical protein